MDYKLRRMKAEPGDKLVEQNCSTCEFNFERNNSSLTLNTLDKQHRRPSGCVEKE